MDSQVIYTDINQQCFFESMAARTVDGLDMPIFITILITHTIVPNTSNVFKKFTAFYFPLVYMG
jgi:hypothetical protein